MKKTLAILGIALLGAPVSFAQSGVDTATKPSRAQERANAYALALGLDEATTQQMEAVFSTAEEKTAQLYKERDAAQARIDETMAPYDEKALSILTPEQRKKIIAMQAEGNWKPEACCAPKEPATGCSGHAKPAGGAGCCAGHGKN